LAIGGEEGKGCGGATATCKLSLSTILRNAVHALSRMEKAWKAHD